MASRIVPAWNRATKLKMSRGTKEPRRERLSNGLAMKIILEHVPLVICRLFPAKYEREFFQRRELTSEWRASWNDGD